MAFLDASLFPELAALEEQVQIFHDELAGVTRWLEWVSDDMSAGGHCRFMRGGWTVFPAYVNPDKDWKSFFSFEGQHPDAIRTMERLIVQLPGLFPRTHEVLRPLSSINYSAYSKLLPRSRLEPHRHQNRRSYIHSPGTGGSKRGSIGIESGRRNPDLGRFRRESDLRRHVRAQRLE